MIVTIIVSYDCYYYYYLTCRKKALVHSSAMKCAVRLMAAATIRV